MLNSATAATDVTRPGPSAEVRRPIRPAGDELTPPAAGPLVIIESSVLSDAIRWTAWADYLGDGRPVASLFAEPGPAAAPESQPRDYDESAEDDEE
jgi:hypothetical protein